MKTFSILLLFIIAIPVKAETFLGALQQYQSSLPAASASSPGAANAGNEVTAPSTSVSVSNATCEEDSKKQNSLPLSFLTGLVLQQKAELNVNHDPSSGRLRISAPAPMIGNCANMLKWNLDQNEIEGKKTYSVSVKFKDDGNCTTDEAGVKKCSYRVAKVAGGNTSYEQMNFEPTILGFQACMEATGVVVNGSVVPAAIDRKSIDESFSGLQESGQLLFLSNGKITASMADNEFRFGKVRQNGCDVYEKIHPTITAVYSTSELERQRLDQQAEELRSCPVNEYQRVADFLDRYDSYVDTLGEVRDNLIMQAAKSLAKKIADNKLEEVTDEDWKVINDFERYIVDPKRQKMAELFESMQSLEGSALAAARTEMQKIRAELDALTKPPYFQKVQVERLLAAGKFEAAEKMEGIRIAVAETIKIGKQEGNRTVTPDMAMERIAIAKGKLTSQVATARENYDIRTGATTGMSQTYRDLSAAMRRNIDSRTQNYGQEIQSEYARIQQGGYCYRYFRNTQKCIQDSMERIQELQTALQHYNKIDMERAAEYDQKAQQYGTMEQEGRVYVAKQNGEEAPSAPAADTTVPGRRSEEQDASQAAAAQQAMMPPWMMQQQTPYGNQSMMNMQSNPYGQMYGQNSSWMGQAGFNGNFGFQGGMGSNFMGMQQPQMGNVGVNWLAMGQQGMGQQGMYGNQMYPMYGNQMGGQMYGQQPMYGQQQYGMPYMQQPMGQMGYMPQAYNYPNFGQQQPFPYR
jgi:hypothetical protein